MENQPLRIKLPVNLFTSHSFVRPGEPATVVLENQHEFIPRLGVAYTLPKGASVRTVRVEQAEDGTPYLELSE